MSRTRRVGLAGVVLAALALPAPLQVAAAAETVCDDLLVTHRPGGSSGDLDAVTVTSQSLDRNVDGWSTVGWEVAAGTELRRVVVVASTGASELPPAATVASGGVLELHFCGTAGGAAGTGPAAGNEPSGTSVAPDRATPTGAVGSASGFVVQRLATRGAGGGDTVRLGILGAAVGAAVGGVVLLLSRTTRGEVIR